jgi:hypothetical protein
MVGWLMVGRGPEMGGGTTTAGGAAGVFLDRLRSPIVAERRERKAEVDVLDEF